jgi:hypothetical protein
MVFYCLIHTKDFLYLPAFGQFIYQFVQIAIFFVRGFSISSIHTPQITPLGKMGIGI